MAKTNELGFMHLALAVILLAAIWLFQKGAAQPAHIALFAALYLAGFLVAEQALSMKVSTVNAAILLVIAAFVSLLLFGAFFNVPFRLLFSLSPPFISAAFFILPSLLNFAYEIAKKK